MIGTCYGWTRCTRFGRQITLPESRGSRQLHVRHKNACTHTRTHMPNASMIDIARNETEYARWYYTRSYLVYGYSREQRERSSASRDCTLFVYALKARNGDGMEYQPETRHVNEARQRMTRPCQVRPDTDLDAKWTQSPQALLLFTINERLLRARQAPVPIQPPLFAPDRQIFLYTRILLCGHCSAISENRFVFVFAFVFLAGE